MQIFEEGHSDEAVALPKAALKLLNVIVTEMARGNAVTVQSVEAELTSRLAGDLLNVSHAYLLKLLEEGAIPSVQSGPSRRIKLKDLLQYQEAMHRDQRSALDELVAEAQELGMGY